MASYVSAQHIMVASLLCAIFARWEVEFAVAGNIAVGCKTTVSGEQLQRQLEGQREERSKRKENFGESREQQAKSGADGDSGSNQQHVLCEEVAICLLQARDTELDSASSEQVLYDSQSQAEPGYE